MRATVLALAGILLAGASARAQSDRVEILDILKVKVRPEKMADYEATIKKMAALNRKDGDHWLAFSTEYGDTGSIYFSSPRQKMADVEAGFAAFEKAISAGLGPAGFGKMMSDLNSMSTSVVGEIRRRRWDLSVNAPNSRQEQMQMVAAARWIRTIKVQVRPGRMPDFVDAWKPWQAELAKSNSSVWTSVSATGGSFFYVALYYKNLAEMDAGDAALQGALASDVYRNYLKAIAPIVVSTNWEIHRMRPELSCMPAEFVALDPAYWGPKATPKPVAKPAEKK